MLARISTDEAKSTRSATAHSPNSGEPQSPDLSKHSFVRSCFGELSDVTLGRPIASGIFITFSEGAPSLHIKAISVGNILKSVSEQSHALSDSISRYQYVRGVTPSKEGLRVFSLVLQKLSDGSREVRQEIRSLAEEALNIDLTNKKNGSWHRELSTSIGGLPVDIRFSIEKRPSLERVAARMVGRDLPLDAHQNTLAYKIEISPSECKNSQIITAIKNRVRQVVAVSTIVAPIAVASTAEFLTGASEALMTLSNNSSAKFALENLSDFGIPTCAGYIALSLRSWLSKRKAP